MSVLNRYMLSMCMVSNTHVLDNTHLYFAFIIIRVTYQCRMLKGAGGGEVCLEYNFHAMFKYKISFIISKGALSLSRMCVNH